MSDTIYTKTVAYLGDWMLEADCKEENKKYCLYNRSSGKLVLFFEAPTGWDSQAKAIDVAYQYVCSL